MRIRHFFALAVAALAVSSVACSASEEPADDNAVTPNDEETDGADELKSLTLDESSNGKTVNITKGQNVVVKLQSNPTTGFEWSVTSTDRTFGYPAEKFLKNGDAVGSGGIQRFTWKTSGPLDMTGAHKVKLEYRRSFEKDKPAAKTFELTINVVDGSCPQLSPPAPGFCKTGKIVAKKDANGCSTGYECQADCRANSCGDGRYCSYCWGSFACIPKGAMC